MNGEQPPTEAAGDTLTDQERKAIAVGQCNYMFLALLSVAALVCGNNAAWTCNFAERRVTYKDQFDLASTCSAANFTYDLNTALCNTILTEHGVGFYHWYGTVPVNTKVCISYTLLFPWGWITPEFDAAFTAAQTFSIMANVFGALAWFTMIFATCCPMSQDRIKGLSCYFSFACICQCFTFLLYSSNICSVDWFSQYVPQFQMRDAIESVTCSLGLGAKYSIAASVLYLVCSGLAPAAIAPPPIGYRPGQAPSYYQQQQPVPQQEAQAPPGETPAADPENQQSAAPGGQD
ncbi:expressed unknown protein [Seminavis robusta]|uniref:Uncharacterized protein n=1 Tax=Seminavis robusta TaxID=568900 RepID=A0A9N8ENG6_9STRA|nr:expressed unknown protein [Seminavis robusta]|eukprot:Sro1389_g268590.1 n/a (291) ;mRNA; f:24737-25693